MVINKTSDSSKIKIKKTARQEDRHRQAGRQTHRKTDRQTDRKAVSPPNRHKQTRQVPTCFGLSVIPVTLVSGPSFLAR